MRKLICLLGLAVVVVVGAGCSYKASVPAVDIANIYTSYEEKIPGTVALIVDAQEDVFDRTIKPNTYTLGAHKYPIAAATAFKTSVLNTTKSVFENVVDRNEIPNIQQMYADNLNGYLVVHVKHFEPRISFIQGFWSATASSTVEIAFDFTVRDKNNGLILSSAVSASRTAEGDAGGAGAGGAPVIADATKKAVTEALERYAERLSNSSKLREAFAVQLKTEKGKAIRK